MATGKLKSVERKSGQNEVNRVCIVALDALEYDLVKELDLCGLMQKGYGKIDVTMFKHLSTPVIWTSFISGLPPEKHGVKLKRLTKSHKLLRLLPEKLRHKFPLWTRKRFFKTTRIKKEQTNIYEDVREQFKKQNLPTFFDIPNSVAISVPPYQKWISDKTLRLNREVIEGKIPFVIFQEHVYSVFRRKKRKLLDVMNSDRWTLVMAHFMFTDLLAHHKIRNKKKMLEVYLKAEKLIREVNSRLPKQSILVIVSDHGMEYCEDLKFGDHTTHGFYSCNVNLGLKNPKITDFYPLILDNLLDA